MRKDYMYTVIENGKGLTFIYTPKVRFNKGKGEIKWAKDIYKKPAEKK